MVEIAETFAHEIGHIVGIYHDFDSKQNKPHITRNRTCGLSRWSSGHNNNQIMNYQQPRQPTWSDCSREDFSNYYMAVTAKYNGEFCLKQGL